MKGWVRHVLLVVMLASPLTLSGCWDRVEINDIAIVVASAVDKGEDGKIRMTVQIPLVSKFAGLSGGGGDKNFIIDSETASTVREANAKQQTKLSRRLFFAHRRVFLVSEDVAKSTGIREIFDVLVRMPGNRLNAQFAIVKGDAYKLLMIDPKLEKFSGEAIREILESESVLSTRMKDVAQMLNQYGVDPIIPYLGLAEKEKKVENQADHIKLLGYAMFQDDKMVGSIKSDAGEGVFWLKQDFHPYGKTFAYQDGKVSLHINKGEAKVTPVLQPDHIQFNVEIHGSAYMMESSAAVDFSDPEQVKKVEQKLIQEIRESLEQAVEKIQESESDVAQLGLVVGRTYPAKWQMEYMPRWREELKKAKFTFDIEIKISRVGLTSKNVTEKVRR